MKLSELPPSINVENSKPFILALTRIVARPEDPQRALDDRWCCVPRTPIGVIPHLQSVPKQGGPLVLSRPSLSDIT